MIKNNNIKIMGMFASVLLLVIVITASFAYFGSFNVNLNNNVAVNVNSVSPGDVLFVSNATQLNLQVPAVNMSQTQANNTVAAASNTATLTVSLNTTATNLITTCTYDIVYEYDSNSNIYGVSPTTKNGDKEITLQVSDAGGTNNFETEKNFDSTTISSYKNGNAYTLVSGATISSTGTRTTQNISITGRYYNLNIPQTSLEGKAFTGKIYVANHKCTTKKFDGIPVAREDVIAVRGTFVTEDGEQINSISAETIKNFLTLEQTIDEVDSISGYSVVATFRVKFNEIISVDAVYQVPGVKEGDTIIVKELINNTWQTIDATVVGDDQVNFNLENEGLIAIYKKNS